MTDIAERLNADAINEAALSVASQMAANGYGEVILTPGDATAYPFIVLPAGRELCDGTTRRNYLVVLAASFGGSYEWTGHRMHADYCAGKWTHDGHVWTGVVIAEFLNALSPLVAQVA